MESLSAIADVQQELSAKSLTDELRETLAADYAGARRRLIILDYDGTLAPFAEKPALAKPDEELLDLLGELARGQGNEAVIISGRDKNCLQEWFGGLDIGLVAEHGVWMKERAREWELMESLKSDWKEEVRPFLELSVDKTPGSFIEEKEFSLVWHYRKAEPELGSLRARELKDELLHLTANLDLGVLEGSKVLEIKSAGANKGNTVLKINRANGYSGVELAMEGKESYASTVPPPGTVLQVFDSLHSDGLGGAG